MSLIKFFLISFLSYLVFPVITNGQMVQTKPRQTLNKKVQSLMDMNLNETVLRLNGQHFREYIKKSPRNYSVIVMFTAMDPSRLCDACIVVHDEFKIVADSYRYSSIYSNKLFFGMVDLDEAFDVFEMLHLNNAPVIMHFPAKGKPIYTDYLDFSRLGFAAEAISNFVHKRTDIRIPISRPTNHFRTVAIITVGALLAGFLYWRRKNLGFLLKCTQLWGFFAIVFCFAMISGQMWNHINRPPYMGQTQSGDIGFISDSSRMQLVIETYIVIFLLILLLSFVTFIVITNAKVKQQKAGKTLSEKVQHLLDVNVKKSLLKFNGQSFREYVIQSPRNYTLIVLFNALAPARKCEICYVLQDEFTIAADSYRHSSVYSNKLFFGMVDFDEASDVFKIMKLNNAPVIMLFPEKGNRTGADTLDIFRYGLTAEAISKFVQQRTDIEFRIIRSPNYSKNAGIVTLGTLLAGFLYWKRNKLRFLYNKNLWGFLAILFCFAMISGQMWNHIKAPPFYQKSSPGLSEYISRSSQMQVVSEMYIIMFLNAMITFGMILLIESGQQSGWCKNIMTIIGVASVIICFSILVSVFRVKSGGYPYRLLFS